MNVIISAPVFSLSGYGKKATDFCRVLLSVKPEWRIFILPTHWGDTLSETLPINDPITKCLVTKQQLKTTNIKFDIYFHIGLPLESFAEAKVRVCVSSLVETSQLHPSWVQELDTKWDYTIVPSNFSKQLLLKSPYQEKGKVKYISKPVEIVIEGINPRDITKNHKEFDLSNIDEDFCFIFVGTWLSGSLGEDRKNVGSLVKYFYKAFANRPSKPALLLKTNTGKDTIFEKDKILKDIEYIRTVLIEDGVINLPNIYLLDGVLSDDELFSLYNHDKIKSMVSLSKGEAVGRPLLEFAMTGKPVITTNWSAPTEYLREEDGHILLNYTLKNIDTSASVKNMLDTFMKWADVDEESTIKGIVSTFDNYQKADSRFVINNFSKIKMSEQLKNVIKQIEKDARAKF